MIDIGHMMFLYLPILMIFFICVLFAHAGSKSYQEAHRALSYKACTTEGAVHCTNFAFLMEKVAEWNATVISKDESGTQPSIVSIFSGCYCVTCIFVWNCQQCSPFSLYHF